MRTTFRRLLGAALCLAMLWTLTPTVRADEAIQGLKVTAASAGTLVTSEEQLASITLENISEEEILLHVSELGQMSQVTIAPGESYTVSAPAIYDENGDAYKLCLTGEYNDGIAEYPLAEGVCLPLGKEYTVSLVRGVLDYYVSHGQQTARWLTCFVYADENGVDPERSVLAGVNGTVTAGVQEIEDISIYSMNDNTSGIRAGGTGEFTVKNAEITLYGDGGDDFTGIGAALGVADTATLNVVDAEIYTEGILRSAIFAGDEAVMNLDEVKVDCEPGEYQTQVNIPSAGMASPPNGLGIWGNCRAMNMVDAASVNIVNSEIISQDWGALGVDDVTDGHLTVKDSTIRIKDQGYGAYAIGKCVDVFENCVFDIEYGVVGFAAAGDGAEMCLSGGSQAESHNYYGFVTHQSFNGQNAKITVTGAGTSLWAKQGGIIAKGRGADVEISDGAVVEAETGVLVRAQINDDTGAGTMDGTEVVNVTIRDTALTGDIIQGMGAAYEEATEDFAMPEGEMGEMPAMPEGGMGPGGPGGPGGMGGSAKTESTMNVTLSGASLEGAISSAELTLAIEDGNISLDNILDVGVVTETVLTHNAFARLNVSLENGGTWTVTETSYLMGLDIGDGCAVEAQPGMLLKMTVDGAETPIEAGSYTGEIVLSVAVDESYVPEEPVSIKEKPEPAGEQPEEPAPQEPVPTAQQEPQPVQNEKSTGVLIGVIALVVVLGAGVIVFLKKKK